jgi:hypothetical protein
MLKEMEHPLKNCFRYSPARVTRIYVLKLKQYKIRTLNLYIISCFSFRLNKLSTSTPCKGAMNKKEAAHMTKPKDDEYKLSYKDVQIYARQLGAVAIEDHFKSGKFDLDIAKFGPNEQRRIRGEIKQLIRNLNGVSGSTLPPEKPGRPRKGEKA